MHRLDSKSYSTLYFASVRVCSSILRIFLHRHAIALTESFHVSLPFIEQNYFRNDARLALHQQADNHLLLHFSLFDTP